MRRRLSLSIIFVLLVSLFSFYQMDVGAEGNIKSPIVHSDGSVTFQLADEGQESVAVAGSFTDWAENAIPLEQKEQVWSVTIPELKPAVYEYKFIINGSDWIQDPLNANKIGDNNSFVIEGIHLDRIPTTVQVDSQIDLLVDMVEKDGTINENVLNVEWKIKGNTDGIELNDHRLLVSKDVPDGTVFTLIAKKGHFQAEKELTVVSAMKEYEIYYHRINNELDDWNLHIFNSGYNPGNYSFDSIEDIVIDNDRYSFAKGNYQFPNKEITIIPRKGEWEQQDTERTIQLPENQARSEVWVIQGHAQVYSSEEEAVKALKGTVPPHIQFTYERDDQKYDDWDVWVWNTNSQDDNIDFKHIVEGKALAEILIGPGAERVGFKVRKGNWEAEEPGGDRYIPINTLDSITKVYVKSGEAEFHVVPSMTAPFVKDGHATFRYRNKQLYELSQMDTIEKVELQILDETYEMEYEPDQEWFTYTFKDLPTGEHEYSFFVTIDGERKNIKDPYFSVDGKSTISYEKTDAHIQATVSPKEITYNENAVVKIQLDNEKDIEIKDLYIDLTSLGGKSSTKIDPELMELSIAANHTTTAGVKKLPVTVVDQYGNEHRGETEITIKSRTTIGEIDFDWDEARIYFLLTDRFFNGDSSNDDPYDIGYNQKDPGAYQGGDFKGITQNLDYLQDLGINTIWISPIVENIAYDVRHDEDPHITPYYGYHGYWASNFTELNPHFGTLDDLHELIDEAHNRGIKLMVDVVLNHAGYGLKVEDTSVESKIQNYPTQEDRERFTNMFRNPAGYGDINGELSGLPDFMTEDPKVRAQLIQWQTDWIEKATTPNGNTIDYFRVDTVKHVENTTWMAFKNALTQVNPSFKMIGEAWGASQFNDLGYLQSGMMDSLLDFDFKYQARDFINGKIEAVENNLSKRNEQLSNDAMLGQFLSSHDEEGFLKQFENDENKLGKLMIAAALQITAKGQPIIYYGEEIGFTGENNYPIHTNRNFFQWDALENNDIHQHYKKLLQVRKEYSDVFSKGDRKQLIAKDSLGYSVFERSYNGEALVVGLNTNETEEQIHLTVPFEAGSTLVDLYSQTTVIVKDDHTVEAMLPAMSDGGTFILAKLIDEEDGAAEEPNEEKIDEEDGAVEEPNEEKIDEEDGVVEEPNEEPVTEENVNTGEQEQHHSGKDSLDPSEEAGKQLPNTATKTYNYLIIGSMIMLVSGIILLLYRKKV